MVRLEFTDQWLAWQRLVRNHVVTTNLGPAFDLFKHVHGAAHSVVHEELLDSRRFVLVLHGFAREKADRPQLVSDNEGLSIAAELAVQWIVPNVAVDRVNAILTEVLKNLLRVKVPEQEGTSITASHQQLLEYGVWSKDPRIFLELVAARAGQVVVEGFINGVPKLDAAHFILKLVFGSVAVALSLVDLRCDRRNGKSAPNRPLYRIALRLRKF